MTNVEIDRRLVRRLLLDDGSTQATLADDCGVNRPAVARRLCAMQRAGAVVLTKVGQQQIPRLAIFTQFDALCASITSLRASITPGA
jgi:predicted transcriptional regulator